VAGLNPSRIDPAAESQRRQVNGIQLSDPLRAKGAIRRAFRLAVISDLRRCEGRKSIRYQAKVRPSDTLSEDYQRVLDAYGIICSMSRRGDCYDNAVMEAFFSSVKSETADRFASREAKMLFDYIEVFYNQRRRHSTLGQISPAAFERRATQAA
jgi:putative transposase